MKKVKRSMSDHANKIKEVMNKGYISGDDIEEFRRLEHAGSVVVRIRHNG